MNIHFKRSKTYIYEQDNRDTNGFQKGVMGRRDSLSLFIFHWRLGGTLFSYCDNYIAD